VITIAEEVYDAAMVAVLRGAVIDAHLGSLIGRPRMQIQITRGMPQPSETFVEMESYLASFHIYTNSTGFTSIRVCQGRSRKSSCVYASTQCNGCS
jgi:hypothetical protein